MKKEKGEIKRTSVIPELAPARWEQSCTHTECSLHQLSPYIGKIKSSIARDLVKEYSRKGDLVVDPFAGACTIPLEAALQSRRAFGSDISPYAGILSRAKLFPPATLEEALGMANLALDRAEALPDPDLSSVPESVRCFFHPRTLQAAVKFAGVVRPAGNDFLMACFLGILHHQRPGFLSYPSSHLVPYLRDQKYPRTQFPEMYRERALRPRLLAKIARVYKRFQRPVAANMQFCESPVETVKLPESFDALITSPPYMNALDYGRDNRLRLWFIDPLLSVQVDNEVTQTKPAFIDAIKSLAQRVEIRLKQKGFCVFVVGVALKRRFDAHPSHAVVEVLREEAPSLRLRKIVTDNIPDVRRSRRACRGVKAEHILIFQKK